MRDFIGQRLLVERLGEQAIRGALAHAYVLSGPRSIGKRTAATRLSQTLNCERGGSGGCGTCTSCLKIERGTHPDVRILERDLDKKDIGIEQIRDVLRDLSLRPLEGTWRVVIVDDAADLNQYGQDALLKTLEEPPPHAVILLVTPIPMALHETILSRAQPLALRLVPTAEIAAALRARFGAAAERHAPAAGGRPGLAIALATDPALREERARLEAELYRLAGSGLIDRFAWAADLADDDDPQRRSRALRARFEHWGELLRDAAVAAGGVADRPLRPDRASETAKLASGVAAKDLVDAALLVERMRRDLDFNANARLTLELLALRLPYASTFARPTS